MNNATKRSMHVCLCFVAAIIYGLPLHAHIPIAADTRYHGLPPVRCGREPNQHVSVSSLSVCCVVEKAFESPAPLRANSLVHPCVSVVQTSVTANRADELTRHIRSGAVSLYWYDQHGRRVAKSESGLLTLYIWDGMDIIATAN